MMLRVVFGCLIPLLVCLTAFPAWAITYVGSQAGAIAGTVTAQTITFALTGGSGSAPIADDLVVVTWCAGVAINRTLTIRNTSGADYGLIGNQLFFNDVFDGNLRVAYRVMPTPVETQVVLSELLVGGTGDVAGAGAYHIFVLRGVNATPLEQAAQQGTAINTMLINPGSITPTTAGTFIYVSGCAVAGSAGTYTQGDLTDFRAVGSQDNTSLNLGAGYFPWTSGIYSPATYGGGGTDSIDDSYGWTIAAFAPAAGASGPPIGSLMLGGVGR